MLRFSASAFGLALCCSLLASTALAQTIPAPADVGRIDTRIDERFDRETTLPMTIPDTSGTAQSSAPEGAEDIRFTLREVNIEGATAIPAHQLRHIYANQIGTEVSLASVWQIAADITKHYRDEQYFLSRAYVPAQEIEDGTITIRVVEGHVGHVNIPDTRLAELGIIKTMTRELAASKPVKASELESFVLRVNDLPGASFRAVLTPYEAGSEDQVALELIPLDSGSQGRISIDNHGSRYLGPLQATATYATAIHPLHQTVFSLSSTLPADELKYGALAHRMALSPSTDIEISGSYVTAEPGFTLEQSEIESESMELGLAWNWRPVRQWRKNLAFSLQLDGKNTDGDILGTALTRDRIRVARTSMTFDNMDNFSGSNYLDVTLSHGLSFLGASNAGAANLSRAEAEPDFSKAEFTYLRQQAVGGDFLAVGLLAGQYASKPLYSSEEFGYGGQRFGRAYDPSEITGDHGIAASLELRYQGLSGFGNTAVVPFVFYDIGKVWNEDTGGTDASGASTGLGLLLSHSSGVAATLTAAQPLTRSQEAPHYGNGNDPRFLFSLSYGF